ncbi:MAG: hypothetical protein C5S48_06190 [Candidatus Methanogaster sp.]|nr:MAG: hypothetical protein C5S48_06190 [ANME-2 cluster archaeon]
MCIKVNVEEPPECAKTVAGGALFGQAAGGPIGAAIGGFGTVNWRLIGREREKKKELVKELYAHCRWQPIRQDIWNIYLPHRYRLSP